MKHRTPAYWLTRIMLAAALLSPVVVAVLWLSAPRFMGPMSSGDRMEGAGPVSVAVGAVLGLVGFVWILRIVRGARDEPPSWRYRGRRSTVHGKRTPAWWLTRFLLAIAIGLILVSAFVAWLTPGPFIDPRPALELGPLLIPAEAVGRVAALAVALVGLVWMIRIFRGLREDEPPPWRYRDR